MPAELNFFDTYTLMAVQKRIVPKQTFFRDRYFPTEEGDIFSSNKVLTEYMDGDRKMAAFVSPRVGAIPMERTGYEVHEFEPASIGVSRPLTSDDLTKRGFGEAIYANSTPAQRAAKLVQNDLADMDGRITRTEEWMCAQTMLDNGCVMQEMIDNVTKGEAKVVNFYNPGHENDHILDEIIDKLVRQIFARMKGIPKEQLITKRYERELSERKSHLQTLQAQRNKAEKDLLSLKAEILACIKGESALPKEILAEMITTQEEKLKEAEALCESVSAELEKTTELMEEVAKQYEELISYADLYDHATFEAKKMIVNQLIRRVDVYRGYQISVSFNFNLSQYFEGIDSTAC